MSSFFGSLVWHLVGMRFVQVGRLECCCCCLFGLVCDGSDTNDAFLFYQDVFFSFSLMVCSGRHISLSFISLLRIMNVSPSKKFYQNDNKKPVMLSVSITKVAHLRLSLQLQQPQLLALELTSVLLALASAWGAFVSSAPASTLSEDFSASGRLIHDAQTGQLHIISPNLQPQ